MKSIKTKFIILIFSALLTLSLLIGGFAIWDIDKLAMKDSESMLTTVCNEQALRLDMQLNEIKQAVTIIYNYANDQLYNYDGLESAPFRNEYLQKVETLALNIANNTEGVRTVYFRMNPELEDPLAGFFLVKQDDKMAFAENEITDILAFDKEDIEHVGWYYLPIEAGEPIWMSPYYNKNIGVNMISYVIPFFLEGKVVGVIGMDIDFEMFVDMAQEAALYDGGRANLIDMATKTIYYKEKGKDEILEAPITEILYENLENTEASEKQLSVYNTDDEKYVVAFQTVTNGMKYILYNPVAEIRAQRTPLLWKIIFITVGSLILFVAYTTIMTGRITNPLLKLTNATEKIAEGNWNVDIEYDTKDEVGILACSIKMMAEKINLYVSEINALAYKDGLTGVKNKACYNDYISVIAREETEDMNYAVIVFDINNLKVINDNYGHKSGDSLIKTACSYICNIFKHSPVFRIGGDEFVAILEGEDFEHRFELLTVFEAGMKELIMSEEPFSAIKIAYGIAEHTYRLREYDAVFKLADERMYEKKKDMKKLTI